MASYIALIHKDGNSDYGVSFPDFPGCITAGHNLDEARRMAAEALALHIEGMIEDGATLPEPSDLDHVMREPGNREAVAFLVDVPVANERAVRVNITLPETVLRQIDRVARERHTSRSGFLAEAAKRAMAETH